MTCSNKFKQSAAFHLPDKDSLNIVYSFIPSAENAVFAQSMQPDVFSLDNADNIIRKQRQWIYALLLLGPEDEVGRIQLRQLLADDIFRCSRQKIAAITAHLSGRLRERAMSKQNEIWQDIQLIEQGNGGNTRNVSDQILTPQTIQPEEMRAKIEIVKDHSFSDKNPDYNNPEKEKGWREPEARMIERAWGTNCPLKRKRILLLETPQLLEWKMMERMGAEEKLLTIVERERELANEMRVKLPGANVVHGGLKDFLLSSVSDGSADEAQNETIENFYFRIIATQFPKIQKMLTDRRFSMPIHNAPEMTGVSSGRKFDLVSMDTKSQFDTERRTVQLLFDLGLLRSDALFFTNFVAQRESDDKKRVYNDSILKRLFAGFRQKDEPNLDSELKDKRSLAIFHEIRSIAIDGSRNNLNETLARSELGRGLELADLFSVIIEFQKRGGQASSSFISFNDLESFLILMTAPNEYVDKILRNKIIQTLIKRRLALTAADKRFKWLVNNIKLNKIGNPRFADLFFKSGRHEDDLPEVLSGYVYMLATASAARSYGILNHESYSYHDKTLMHSDFLRLQDIFRATGLTQKSAKYLGEMLLGNLDLSKKERVEFQRNVIASISPFIEFFSLDDIDNCVARVNI